MVRDPNRRRDVDAERGADRQTLVDQGGEDMLQRLAVGNFLDSNQLFEK